MAGPSNQFTVRTCGLQSNETWQTKKYHHSFWMYLSGVNCWNLHCHAQKYWLLSLQLSFLVRVVRGIPRGLMDLAEDVWRGLKRLPRLL